MSFELLLSLVQPSPTAKTPLPPPAPAPFDAVRFMCYNDMTAPLSEKGYWHQLEYPLVCVDA